MKYETEIPRQPTSPLSLPPRTLQLRPAMSNAKRSSFKFHDLLRRCAAFLTSSSAGCGRGAQETLMRSTTLTERIFSACRNFGSLILLPFLLAPSFFAFHLSQMILLNSVHCLAVGIVALRDDANPSSWLFVRIISGNAASQMEAEQPLEQASGMPLSPK